VRENEKFRGGGERVGGRGVCHGGGACVLGGCAWGDGAWGCEFAMRVQGGSDGDRCAEAAVELGVEERGTWSGADEL